MISAILALIGIVGALAIPMGKANLGTDFSGGVAVQLRFEKSLQMETVRAVLAKGGFPDADLQQILGTNKLLVKVGVEKGIKGVAQSVGSVFKAGMPGNPFIVDSVTEVGPTVGKKLQKDALWAIAISLFSILLYVAWRFEFSFAVAGVIATFHDVLAVMGILFILDKEINLTIITALLTLAGYSLNDSVVLFDRIRENLRKGVQGHFDVLVNRSINEVLGRTVVTSGTTLLVLLALFFLGGEVIHDFSLALLLGVIVGTYSSMFVASPLVLIWKDRVKAGSAKPADQKA